MKRIFFFIVVTVALALLVGCGSKSLAPGQRPIDPSGNWALKASDSSGNQLLLSGLFSQTGSVVTALNVLDFGNPAPFSCSGPLSMSNGQVQNVSQFSGDIAGGWGTLHFTSTLNDAGTHASGTYTLTQSSNCAGIALTGTFAGDEIPSVSGSWTGTLACTSNCPTGSTSGSITMTLAQNDSTGAVTGTYAVTGLPGFSSGTVAPDQFSLLSGAFWQDHLADQNGNTFTIAGGPGGLAAGLGLDRSFNGVLLLQQSNNPSIGDSTYTISMSH